MKVLRVIAIAIRGFLSVVRRDRPRDVSALGDRNGAAVTASSGRSAAEDWGRRENLQRSGREEAGSIAREILPTNRLAPGPVGCRA